MLDRPGAILGRRYRLEYCLGAGAMARVWCATDLRTQERVAIKRVLETVRDPVDTTARFLDEIRVTRTVEHPHVAAGLDHGLDGGPFLVLEWVDGIDAHALVSREEGVARGAGAVIALDLANALSAVHSHRTECSTGTSCRPTCCSRETAAPSRGLRPRALALACPSLRSPAHIAVGKLGYLAPEVLRGRVHGVRADLYGLGATLWELLAGRRLWAHETDPAARCAGVAAQPENSPRRGGAGGSAPPGGGDRPLPRDGPRPAPRQRARPARGAGAGPHPRPHHPRAVMHSRARCGAP